MDTTSNFLFKEGGRNASRTERIKRSVELEKNSQHIKQIGERFLKNRKAIQG